MTIPEYISEQDPAVQPRLNAIYDTIRGAIPDAEERLSWGMPTFWKGRNIIHFAVAKHHIGLKASYRFVSGAGCGGGLRRPAEGIQNQQRGDSAAQQKGAPAGTDRGDRPLEL